MEEQTTLYKLIFNLNLTADMKLTFNTLYNEVREQLDNLTQEERTRLEALLNPRHVINDLEEGLGEFWAESADSYKPIDLENID